MAAAKAEKSPETDREPIRLELVQKTSQGQTSAHLRSAAGQLGTCKPENGKDAR